MGVILPKKQLNERPVTLRKISKFWKTFSKLRIFPRYSPSWILLGMWVCKKKIEKSRTCHVRGWLHTMGQCRIVNSFGFLVLIYFTVIIYIIREIDKASVLLTCSLREDPHKISEILVVEPKRYFFIQGINGRKIRTTLVDLEGGGVPKP